jgi:hypothetical protein
LFTNSEGKRFKFNLFIGAECIYTLFAGVCTGEEEEVAERAFPNFLAWVGKSHTRLGLVFQ